MKILKQSTYNDLILMQELVMSQNAELKKVCQCRERKNGTEFLEGMMCQNPKSDNYREYVNYYGSCEQCERR